MFWLLCLRNKSRSYNSASFHPGLSSRRAQGRIGTSQTWFLPLPGPLPHTCLSIQFYFFCCNQFTGKVPVLCLHFTTQRCPNIKTFIAVFWTANNWKQSECLSVGKIAENRVHLQHGILCSLYKEQNRLTPFGGISMLC